ncbi:MAG: lytic transglycosylase domain-containing protein [Nitrospinaceae bacterium]
MLSKNWSTVFSLTLAIACTGFFSGKLPYAGKGMSPYVLAAHHWEGRVFLEHRKTSEYHSRIRETRVRDQIFQVVSKYRTGLDSHYLQKISHWIVEESQKYRYDPLLLTALIITESSFYNWARSHRGALGLMQIQPETGMELAAETRLEWRGKPTLYDPAKNIALGAYYLNKLIQRFGDLALALEAYNYGPTRLVRYLKRGYRPQGYSRRVLNRYELIRPQPI